MQKYKSIDFATLSSKEIIQYYKNFENTLLLKWKAPLINDFFAMIWFGILKKMSKKNCPNEPNIHNDLLCGSQDIISVEPVHKSISISQEIQKNKASKEFFLQNSPKQIWQNISTSFPEIKEKIDDFIEKFGNRCVGELKLETISYSEDPTLYVKLIKSYVEQGVTNKNISANIEEELRVKAEDKIFEALKGKSFKRFVFKYILRKTRKLVSNRENLRFERTRGFGMVRKMFIELGKRWQKEGYLKHERDIFYLELNEITSAENEFDLSLKQKIESREEEFENYKNQEPPKERFFTYGNNFADEYIYSTEKVEEIKGDLEGIGCSPGIVQSKVCVVENPSEIDSLKGDILVARSTDPGWVTLFPTASAIIVERGSLLSHSAIVSREMGIPCIVSVDGLLRTLKTGDEVLMNGSTGKIKLIKNG